MERTGLLRRTVFVFVLVGLAGVARATVQRGSVRLEGHRGSAERWAYLGKFGYAVGEGTYSLRVRVPKGVKTPAGRRSRWPPSLNLDVFLDEDWATVEAMHPCQRAHAARRRLTVELNEEAGEYGNAVHGLLYQVVRPHIWYFAVSDCHTELGNHSVNLEYDLHAMQFDGSELGVEARFMPLAESFALLGLSVLLVVGASRCESLRRSAGALHPVIWALAAVVALQYASQPMHLVHLVAYKADGIGFWLLDWLAEVLFLTSQAAHATLLIALAQGYTLLHPKDCYLDFSKLAFVATLAAHAALSAFGKMQEGASSQHHENDGPVGWVIVAARVLLLVWFVCAARATRERGGIRLREFMQQFELAGSLYFLAYPVVFVITQLFAPYLRHPIMQIGLLSMQAAGDAWLAGLFLSRGAYYKASCLSASVLPGGVEGGSPRRSPIETPWGFDKCA